MRQDARDLLVFLLFGTISCTLARPLRHDESSSLPSPDDFQIRMILRDLLADGNSPVESVHGKKLMKNASGINHIFITHCFVRSEFIKSESSLYSEYVILEGRRYAEREREEEEENYDLCYT